VCARRSPAAAAAHSGHALVRSAPWLVAAQPQRGTGPRHNTCPPRRASPAASAGACMQPLLRRSQRDGGAAAAAPGCTEEHNTMRLATTSKGVRVSAAATCRPAMAMGRRRSTRWLSAVLVALLAAGNATAQGAPRASPLPTLGSCLVPWRPAQGYWRSACGARGPRAARILACPFVAFCA
jgi:hypothetical protein